MELKKITYPLQNEYYNKSIFHIKNEKLEIQFGTVFLQSMTVMKFQLFKKEKLKCFMKTVL